MNNLIQNYHSYKLENELFQYTPNNILHFLYLYYYHHLRWI